MAYLPRYDRYSKFSYRCCGSSGLLLPPISLGFWHNFGAAGSFKAMQAMVKCAFDRGINHFDLANNYGPPPGSAEVNMGRLLAEELKAYRDELIISTKAGYLMWEGPLGKGGSRKHLLSSLDQSLKRLGLDYVDIFYHHCPDPETPIEESMGALASAVQSGKALYAGVSNYRADKAEKAFTMLREMGVPCVINQPNYNLFDRWIETDLLPLAEECGVGTIVYSPLAQGLLSGRYLKGIPEDSRAADPKSLFLKPEHVQGNMIRIKALHAIAQTRGQSLAQMAVTWILQKKSVSSALIGASSTGQIAHLADGLNAASFTDEELHAIDAACQC